MPVLATAITNGPVEAVSRSSIACQRASSSSARETGIVGSVGCYQGFQVKGGAEGVGRATTKAVVTAIILIIVSDAILDYFLLFRFD